MTKELQKKISVVAICLHLRQTERVCATDLVFALARMRDKKFRKIGCNGVTMPMYTGFTPYFEGVTGVTRV